MRWRLDISERTSLVAKDSIDDFVKLSYGTSPAMDVNLEEYVLLFRTTRFIFVPLCHLTLIALTILPLARFGI